MHFNYDIFSSSMLFTLTSSLVYVLFVSNVVRIAAFKVFATMYTDNSVAAGGAKLSEYPARIELNARSVNVYPIAMYSDRIATFKYKIVKLHNRKNGRTAYAHVIDECASGDCHENRALARKKGSVLIDVHKSMWNALGLNEYGIHQLEGVVATSKRYTFKNSPGIRRVTSNKAKHNYLPAKWKL